MGANRMMEGWVVVVDSAQSLVGIETGRDFDWERDAIGFYDAWFNVYAAAAVLYLPFVFGVEHILRNRKPVHIPRFIIVFWNLFWSVFSGICFVAMFDSVVYSGLSVTESICTDNLILTDSTTNAQKARFLFIIAKLPEMGDTLFLVLRKRPAPFLHYWHHLTVMLFCWQIAYLRYGNEGGDGTYFAFMNAFVHLVMYGYYAVSMIVTSIRRTPLAQAITTMQISQMAVGIWILYHRTQHCNSAFRENLWSGWIMYGSYLVLFAKYYVDRYFSSPKKSKKQ